MTNRSESSNRLRIKLSIRIRKFWYRISYNPFVRRLGSLYKQSSSTVHRLLVVILGIAAIIMTGWLTLNSLAGASRVSVTSDDLKSGYSEYGNISLQNGATSLSLQNGLVGSWNTSTASGLQTPPFSIDSYSQMAYGPNDNIYVMGNYGQQCLFSKYDIEKKVWKELAVPPTACGQYGTQLVYDNAKTMYFMPGGAQYDYTGYLFKYDISSNTWSKLQDMPSTLSNISSSVFANVGSSQYLYVMRGTQIPSFYRYSIVDNSWLLMDTYVNKTSVSYGVSLAFDNGTTIYGLDNNTNEFKKYDIVQNKWTNLPNADVSASASYDSVVYFNNKIYALQNSTIGNSGVVLFEYTPASAVWKNLGTVPGPSQERKHPMAMVTDGSKYLYTLMGYDRLLSLIRYDIPNGQWGQSSLFDTSVTSGRSTRQIIGGGNSDMYYVGGWNGYDYIYRYNYQANTSFTITSAPTSSTVNVLVVAGGGGGGTNMGGGGGGGGVLYNASYSVSAQSYNVIVGAGGKGAPAGTGGHPTIPGTNGKNSIFGSMTAIGGGFGGVSYNNMGTSINYGASGGSGGGSSGYNNDGVAMAYYGAGLGIAGQGYRGGYQGNAYYSGGGGGAGGVGASGNAKANGGVGLENSILGTSYYWGGGGGGAGYSVIGGNGGNGGGGGGAVGVTTGGAGLNNGSPGGGGVVNAQTNTPGGNAGANTGGGGGAGSHYNYTNKGGDGGSGIVVIRYPIGGANDIVATGGTITEYVGNGTNGVNGQRYRVHTFTTFPVNNTVTALGAAYRPAVGAVPALSSTSVGSTGVYKGGYLYLVGAAPANFSRYDPLTDTMIKLTNAPQDVGAGASIVDGGDGYLYANFGAGRTDFYRYVIATDTWETLGVFPYNVNTGGGMSRINRTIYTLAGGDSGIFMKYNMDTKVHSYITSMPNGSIGTGGFNISDNTRYLYICVRTDNSETNGRLVQRYDTTNDTWQRIADLPGYSGGATGYYDNTTNTLHVSQGPSWSDIWEWSPSTAAYVKDGTWYSKTYDMIYATAWGNIDADVTGSGTVEFYTRTSSDGVIWSNWLQTSGRAINSPVNRYIQFKIRLVGDGTVTPSVTNIGINYTKDTTVPMPPSRFDAYSQKDNGTAIISGKNYPYTKPYFSWQGAYDNESGIDGYYIYYGLDSSADPVVDGNFQTNADYIVTTPMTAGQIYYLKMRVKDKQGNISDSQTYFSYAYFFVSPPGSIVKTSANDFNAGTNTNLTVSNNFMSLNNQANGTWSTGPLTMPADATYGTASVVAGDYVFVARGQGTNTFYRYNTISGRWDTMAPVPATTYYSAISFDGNHTIILTRGNSTSNFYKYDINNNQWTVPTAQLPQLSYQGTAMTYIGGGRYAMVFGGGRNFYIYDTFDDSFALMNQLPASTNSTYGSSGLWFDGVDSVYAYTGYTGARLNFAKYSILNDSWRQLAEPPMVSFDLVNSIVGVGNNDIYMFLSKGMSDSQRNDKQNFIRYNVSSDSWSEVGDLKIPIVWGTVASDSKRYIYVLPGQSQSYLQAMIRYDTWTNTVTPNSVQIGMGLRQSYSLVQNNGYNGGISNNANQRIWIGSNVTTAVYDGSKYIYALGVGAEQASSYSNFVKFDYKTGVTVYLTPPPLTSIGGSLGYLNGEVYYLAGKSTPNLYKFDEQSMQWKRMTDTPVNVYRPGPTSLVANGSGTAFYVFIGNSKTLYLYTPSSGGGTWLKMLDAPANIMNGSFTYNSTNNAIYVIAGNGAKNFYRYNITGNTWTTLALLPGTVSYGSTMTIKDGYIYAQQGNGTKASYVYNIGAGTWATSNDAPGYFNYGAVALKVNDTYAVVLPGDANPLIWQFNYPSTTTSYNGKGQYVSDVMNFAGLYDYAGVHVDGQIPSNTTVEIWTRSSDDGGVTWNDWVLTDPAKIYTSSFEAKINSPTLHALQVKFILESADNILTPVIHGYSVNYYYDVTPPNNPTSALVYTDNTKTTQLHSNEWKNFDKPFVDWPDPGEAGGATDGPLGSNIGGYWVYFGPDGTASPRTSGTFVTSTEYQANFTTPGLQYLRIQTQDMTGNIDSNVFAPFTYKFDNIPPTNPSLVTVDPSGFTSINNFSFVWPNGFDQHSGIAGYCYLTGATSGPFASEICQDGTSISNLSAAYRNGTNVFYVRAYDIAGNYSPYYTSASYYYTVDAPTQVTNLRAVPPVSTNSLFTFLWDFPVTYAGNSEKLQYCYSINTIPSPLNTTCTTDRYIPAFKAATQKGVNIIYVVAKDEAGNADWTNFASANFIANTSSPGIPLNLSVVDTSDRSTDRWTLTLTWDQPTFVGTGIVEYIVERSLDGRVFDYIGSSSSRAFVDLNVSSDTTYYYRVRAADDVDNRSGASGIVARMPQGVYPTPPKTIVQPESKADFNQADIRWVTNRDSTSFIYYGVDPTDLIQSKGSLILASDHKVTLTGLQPSTTYFYRIQSFDNDRSYDIKDSISSIFSFRTADAARIFSVTTSDITVNSVVVSWQSSVPTRPRVEYGPTMSYGLLSENNQTGFSTQHTVRLTGLDSGMLYNFKISSLTELSSSVISDNYTFTTIARPVVNAIRFQPLADEPTTAVNITWKTNVPTSSTVYYSGYGTKQEASTSELVTNHSVILQNLAGSTDYTMSIEGRDQYGNVAIASQQQWRSQLDTRPPVISGESISVSVVESVSGKQGQMIISWKTDEPATSQVQYGKYGSSGYGNKTPLSTEPTTSHIVIISGLDLAAIYKIQIISRDLDGNTVYGNPTTIVTPDKEITVFDSVVNLLSRLMRL